LYGGSDERDQTRRAKSFGPERNIPDPLGGNLLDRGLRYHGLGFGDIRIGRQHQDFGYRWCHQPGNDGRWRIHRGHQHIDRWIDFDDGWNQWHDWRRDHHAAQHDWRGGWGDHDR